MLTRPVSVVGGLSDSGEQRRAEQALACSRHAGSTRAVPHGMACNTWDGSKPGSRVRVRTTTQSRSDRQEQRRTRSRCDQHCLAAGWLQMSTSVLVDGC
ncbi:hypothetical protein T310_8456 [Rasamsonia emersonii CBS 393.64]|uniref:Uncharacterized protein n=1 Tax=Rasamsonia emersonii (strain ATCC 16479 / CBS 393.64 / IMI 116815) TaxID=1408163 RepID=A0A0F4YJ13_RASE3|nr:hypothetical protein T310_8456 [Rasamsonia emersonii CBS 393.64]KKA17598.1 hypothetical protein T310_8456 [Rasamsonia emersonii CBS 393.64]